MQKSKSKTTRQVQRDMKRADRNIILNERGRMIKVNKLDEERKMGITAKLRLKMKRFRKFLMKKFPEETDTGKKLRSNVIPFEEVLKEKGVKEFFEKFES